MRQLQVLDEAGGLHVVGMRDDEFFVLRGVVHVLAQFAGAQRAIDQRHGHGLALGLAEDKAEASIACRQVGPISFASPLPQQEEVFSERMSLIFKKLRIVRMVDKGRNSLVYLTYSERLVEGSPQNSVTAVPVERTLPIPLR